MLQEKNVRASVFLLSLIVALSLSGAAAQARWFSDKEKSSPGQLGASTPTDIKQLSPGGTLHIVDSDGKEHVESKSASTPPALPSTSATNSGKAASPIEQILHTSINSERNSTTAPEQKSKGMLSLWRHQKKNSSNGLGGSNPVKLENLLQQHSIEPKAVVKNAPTTNISHISTKEAAAQDSGQVSRTFSIPVSTGNAATESEDGSALEDFDGKLPKLPNLMAHRRPGRNPFSVRGRKDFFGSGGNVTSLSVRSSQQSTCARANKALLKKSMHLSKF